MTAPMPNYTITKRVRGVWGKFSDWYGADIIAKHFGAIPPKEWCEEIDSIESREAMVRVLNDVRSKHPTFPPRFPEFELIVRRSKQPAAENTGPSMQERLSDFVLRHRSLSRGQLRGHTFLYRGNARSGDALQVTGIIVPADGDRPGYRVMVEDMQAESASVGQQ